MLYHNFYFPNITNIVRIQNKEISWPSGVGRGTRMFARTSFSSAQVLDIKDEQIK